MEYRGTVRGGVVILEPGFPLSEGQSVFVRLLLDDTTPGELPGAGLWRDRTDIGDSEDASLDLRRKTERRDQ